MTIPQGTSKPIDEVCEVLIEKGLPGVKEVVEILLNEAMRVERERALKAKPYERTEERQGYANGFKERGYQTRMGSLKLAIPQVRGISFYPQSLERGERSEKALKLAVAEMYLKGVSTRKVKEITEVLCGAEISSTQVSRISAELDEELLKFRTRELGYYRYVKFDARYEKVREAGTVKDLAIIWAYGINEHGQREVLGVSVKLSEAEVHWRSFLEDLKKRGLYGVELFVSDDHSGLKAARKAVFPGVAWQRCQFHLAQNAQSYVPKKDLKPDVAQDVRDVFNASDRDQAEWVLAKVMKKYEKTAPKLSNWMEENMPEGFTIFKFPRSYQKKLRTINDIERMNQEIRRRTRVARIFPNEESCLRLISAILLEQHEEWLSGRAYLNMDDLLENKKEIYRKNVA